MIRERVSSSTVLLLAYTGKNLRYLHIRRNAIILKYGMKDENGLNSINIIIRTILRCEWPRSPDWSEEFYTWLRRSSRSYSDLEREVSQILGFRW